MDNRGKGTLLIILAVLYLFWPLDLLPGCVIDDFAVIAFAYITNKKQIS